MTTPTDRETVERLIRREPMLPSLPPQETERAKTLRALLDERDAAVARAEAAEAALPSVSAKAAEYHAIANAYAMWVSDVCELLEERIGEWDLDDPADAKLKDLMDRAELGIAKETRAALGEGD